MPDTKLTRRHFIAYGLSGAMLVAMPRVSHAGFFDHLFGKHGKLKQSPGVKSKFETYRLEPDLDYYIAGSEQWPVAIVAMDKSYTLGSKKTWKKVDLNAKKLKTMVDRMNHLGPLLSENKTRTVQFYGCDILDDRGNRVGIWYSATRRGVVKMKGDNNVRLYAPRGWC